MSDRRFVVLDGLRGAAALSVVAVHLCLLNGCPWFPPHAALAVEFFFCLSGFVIAHAYDHAFADGGLTRRGFAWRRFVRLYPLVLAGVALGSLVALVGVINGGPDPLRHVVIWTFAGALLVPLGVLFKLSIFPINPALWSLFFEGVANFAYGVVGARRLSRISASIVLALAAAALVTAAIRYKGLADLGFDTGFWFPGGLVRTVYPFLAGVAIARLGWASGRGVLPSVVVLVAGAGVLLWPGLASFWAYDVGAVLLAFPLLIVLGARAEPGPALAKLCEWLGDISYPLYALHMPLIFGMMKVNSRILQIDSPIQLSLLELVLFPIAAWGAFRLYDQPVRGWLTRRAGRLEPNAARDRASAA